MLLSMKWLSKKYFRIVRHLKKTIQLNNACYNNFNECLEGKFMSGINRDIDFNKFNEKLSQ